VTATPPLDQDLVARLDDAATGVHDVVNAGATDVDAAYAVQEALVARRLARGESQVGWKLGFTSLAKMAQMGISDVIVGRLTSGMAVPDGGELDLTRFIHPRVEPEVAYRLARDVDPGEPADDLVSAVDAVAPALEVIDSRYRDFRFTLADVVADNTSAAGFVVGTWVPLDAAGDLGERPVTLSVDGRVAEEGATDAILGHPLPPAWACRSGRARSCWPARPPRRSP
jgi:2-oxo-3-hexenedioate decarboxylase